VELEGHLWCYGEKKVNTNKSKHIENKVGEWARKVGESPRASRQSGWFGAEWAPRKRPAAAVAQPATALAVATAADAAATAPEPSSAVALAATAVAEPAAAVAEPAAAVAEQQKRSLLARKQGKSAETESHLSSSATPRPLSS
jgi:hypothetical protein